MMIRLLALILLVTTVSGCSTWTHTSLFSSSNIKKTNDSRATSKASFVVIPDRGDPDMLMILALSGGGSRAAYWSASVMLRLEQVFKHHNLNLLQQVDAISSVSGGSLPAAYYAISTEPGIKSVHDRVWEDDVVKKLMAKDYITRWIGNWFWPENIAKYWFTAYDRTDIMAQTLADNLYDVHMSGSDLAKGRDLTIGEIQPDRPYLILNATNATSENKRFGKPFTFTDDVFDDLDSDINKYSIARAVMATASFPGAFQTMTLQDFSKKAEGNRYVHIFDGGNVDNLGLDSASKIIDTLSKQQIAYKKLVVILVDAYTEGGGISETQADGRGGLDFFIDTNIVDATDSLLTKNRQNSLSNFNRKIEARHFYPVLQPSQTLFYHLKFDNVKDSLQREKLNSIKTSFNIEPEGVAAIDFAVDQLLTPENHCLIAIKQLLETGKHSRNSICSYRN
jgi:predicted acylesterase/phospholipase RssA